MSRNLRSRADLRMADGIAGHWIDLERYNKTKKEELFRFFDDLQNSLLDDFHKWDIDKVKLPKAKFERLKKLLHATNRTLETGLLKQERLLNKDLQEVMLNSNRWMASELSAAVGAQVFTATITPAQAEALAGEMLIQGDTIKAFFDQEREYLVGAWKRVARQHIAYGEGMAEISRALFDVDDVRNHFVKASEGEWATTRPLMARARSKCLNITRTSVMTAANEGQRNLIETNKDVFRGYEHVSTLDFRTSDQCKIRDGLQWDNEGNIIGGHDQIFRWPPIHFQCRSFLVPILKTWEEMSGVKVRTSATGKEERTVNQIFKDRLRARGLSEDQIKRAKFNARRALNKDKSYLVSRDMKYESWLKRRTKKEQIEALGKARWELWSSGKAKMSDFADPFGNKLNLKQIRKKIEAREAALAGQ